MHPFLTILATANGETTPVDLLAVLATAGLIALLFTKLRLPTIPGFLVAGALIGPHALGFVRDPETVENISRLSTVLLMFIIGLDLDLSRVKRGLFSIIGGAFLATVLMLIMGTGFAYAFVHKAPIALTIAMAMSIAATAAPLKMMEEQRELHSTYGRLAFGITLFQDLIAVAMLALLPALGIWAGVGEQTQIEPMDMVRRAALSLGGITILIVVGLIGLPRLLREAGKVGGEVLIVVSAAVALAGAVFAAWLGFSPELGAFLAGFILASTPFRFQLAGQLIPMRDLFLAVFFTAVGLTLPLREAVDGWWIILLAVGALLFVKVIGVGFASWALGASARIALLAATTLAPAGEFTLVMVSQARDKGLLDPKQSGYIIAVVVLSVLTAPIVWALGRRLAPKLDRAPNAPWLRGSVGSALREEPKNSTPDTAEGKKAFRAIIAGYGPVGRAVADALSAESVDITIIELNPKTVERQLLLGRRVVYGDVSNPEVLANAGIDTADAVIITMPDEEAMLRACRTVRLLRKDVFIAARANALSKGLMAMQLGADHSVVEEMATAEAMGKEVLLKVKDRMAGVDTGPKLYDY